MVRVKGVQGGSIAEELGIAPGTELLSVNGRELADFLDWEFLTADDELVIEARLPGGEAIVYEIERPEGESMGVELEPPTIRRCANPLRVLLIEGLPKVCGCRLRPRRRLPPVVRLRQRHALQPQGPRHRSHPRVPVVTALHLGRTPRHGRRGKLLNNPRVPNIVEQLSSSPRVESSPRPDGDRAGLNDGDVLEESFRDPWAFGDAVLSVAIVPVD
jgi:hypothetical protein